MNQHLHWKTTWKREINPVYSHWGTCRQAIGEHIEGSRFEQPLSHNPIGEPSSFRGSPLKTPLKNPLKPLLKNPYWKTYWGTHWNPIERPIEQPIEMPIGAPLKCHWRPIGTPIVRPNWGERIFPMKTPLGNHAQNTIGVPHMSNSTNVAAI